MGLFSVFMTFFIWSSSFTIGKSVLNYSPPIFLTGFRMALAGVLLLAFLALFRRQDLKIRKYQLFPLLLLALTGVYLTNACEFWGLQYLTAAKACFIYSLSPFLSALFSYIEFKEKMTRRKLFGLLIGMLGFFPYLMQQSGSEASSGWMISWPDLALVVATASASYGWVLLRKLGKDDGMSPLMANGSSMLIGGVFALIHSSFTETWAPTPVAQFTPFFQGVLLMIVVSNLVCYNLYGWLLKRFTATFLSFAGLLTPLFAAFFGYVVLRETVSWAFFLSVGVIALGLWLVYFEELRQGYIVRREAKAT